MSGVAALLGLALGLMQVQAPMQALTQAPQAPSTQGGTVLFSTDKGEPVPVAKPGAGTELPEPTAAVRNAPTFTGYDLDVHLTPAEGRLTVRAQMVVRNDGAEPLRALALQLSSSLTWESVAVAGVPAAFGRHAINTDADHTGRANEAIIALAQPLAVGASVAVTVFYGGEIHANAERLERLGAPPEQAAAADWDAIAPALTALRGYGDVLWYPAAGEPPFLGDGARLFHAVGANRLRQARATVRLRLTVAYVGDAPDAAFFCGRRMALKAVSENQDVPAAESPGVATAEFAAAPLGFRAPSLFLTDRAPTVTDDMLIAAVTDHYDAVPQYAAATALVRPLLVEWLGPQPLTQLQVIDHAGQPFEDEALLVAPMRAAGTSTLAPVLVHALAHAWFRSSHAWLDEGVPQLLSLLWTEQSQGRDAAVASLRQAANTLALAEPEILAGAQGSGAQGAGVQAAGQSLVVASDDVYFRTKAAAVLWMLRSVAGEAALRQTLLLYRSDVKLDEDPAGFEPALERYAHKDLRWFFDDWVYRDRGLPDLAIVNVTPRELPARGGKAASWLVSVEVRNEGDAVAEVPVTVRSGTLTATERLRIPGRASASTRILFEGTPQEVLVNDGTVPEMRTASHTIQIKSPAP